MTDIRIATPDDDDALKTIKDAVWPDDATSEDYIRAILKQPDHVEHLALVNGTPAGLISGFLTLASDGTRRWEVDLLAVHPDFRRRGIATALVNASAQAGREMGADQMRALIRIDNTGSQMAFANVGFQRGEGVCALYISTETLEKPSDLNVIDGLHLIPVNTLNYRGVWLEGRLDVDGFRLAQMIRSRYGLDVAGAVIPQDQPEIVATAESGGYFRVGEYEWWRLG